jgi:glutamate N-acetyltransferase/amino-acid N-acetyltransferase
VKLGRTRLRGLADGGKPGHEDNKRDQFAQHGPLDKPCLGKGPVVARTLAVQCAFTPGAWRIRRADMDLSRSPLAQPFPSIPPIDGVTLRVARARYKQWNRCDLTYVELSPGTAVAGVFTKNLCCSTEVEMGREQARLGSARALVVNAGNSNAFTGYRGREAVEQIMAQVAGHLGCEPAQVFVSSTGVIGVPLPKDKAHEGVAAALDAAPCSWEDAAVTIGTTDTFTKGAVAEAIVDGKRVVVAGIIKGSGMIAPDMATMLGYIFTDAAVSPAFLQRCLSASNESTFSCITVDSDTSTSDTVLAFATGKAGNAPLNSADDAGADAFAAAVHDVCRQLALLVVRDGEGAQKLIEVRVTGAESDQSARRIGLAIANSPLVKTAIAGEDANWGRVVMAVGKAGEPADRDKLSIGFGGVWAAREGLPVADYDEAPVAEHLKGREVLVEVDIGLGNGQATVWTCDLTHGYIAINADYRS